MKVVSQSYEIITPISIGGLDELRRIERAGRACYKTENLITEDGESAKRFVKMLVKAGHESVLEHSSLQVMFVCDRGVSHEIVRHRLASYSQESTRYCNYGHDKFGNEITVIEPTEFKHDPLAHQTWKNSCIVAETAYFTLLNSGVSPELARSVLPNSLKTEIMMTANYREWRHFFKQRTSKFAHPQIRELLVPLLFNLQHRLPIIFDDIDVEA